VVSPRAGGQRAECPTLLRLEALARELERPAILRHGSHDVVRDATGNVRFDLERDLHYRVGQRGEMRDHLVRNAAGIETHPDRIEGNGSVEPFRLGRYGGRGLPVRRRLLLPAGPGAWRAR
jgi:hypothetical protein